MFKRLFWLVTGASFGFGSSFWLQRSVRRSVARYRPAAVAARFGRDVRVAVEEGRTAMTEREAELRQARGRAALGPSAPPKPKPKALGAAPPVLGRPLASQG
ncbi:hypothetical protein BH18ACT1_BH18ACT1_09430 [soil metagenome]